MENVEKRHAAAGRLWCGALSGWYLACAVLLAPTTLVAAQDEEAEQIVEEVVVTGTRTKRSDFTSASPITVLAGASILESGLNDLGEVLRNQVTAGTGGFNQSSNLSGGGSTSIDLRNLGPNRVLVLINGKRVASFSDSLANQAADLTFLPNAMVDRVDILRDGASAIYGSDAVSGVVNIILKERFEGVEASVSAGVANDDGGDTASASFAMGTTSDRGSIILGGEYRYRNNVPQRERDWAAPIIFISGTTPSGFQNGSFFSTGGLFLPDDPNAAAFCTEPAQFGGDEITNVGPNCPSFRSPSATNEVQRYDYSLVQDVLNASKVLSTAAYGTYELTTGVEAFLEVEYAKRRTESILDGNPGSFGTPGVPAGWRVPANNPNNPTGSAGNLFIRPSTTVGIRESSYEADTIRVVAGVRGDIEGGPDVLDGWSYEASWLYTRVDADLRTDAIWNLLRANTISDPVACAADQICASVVNPSGALDALRPGNWTDAEIGYLKQVALARSEFQTSGWFGVLTGPLIELPAGEAHLAVGYETRTEEGFNKPDSVTEAGESVSNQVFTTEGSFTVDELFAELDVPLLAEVPAFTALGLNLQYRTSDYSNFGREDVWRAGLNWEVMPSLRVRASVATAYRAPTVSNLFGGGTVSFDFFTDICTSSGGGERQPGNTIDQNCLLSGVPFGSPQASGQYPVLSGSNPNLEPETADTFSVGLILTPGFLDGLSVVLDYWLIEVDDLISRTTSDTVLDRCYRGPVGLTAPECSQFQGRNPATFVPFNFVNRLSNLNRVETDGFDLRINYAFDGVADSVWLADLQGTYVKENTFFPGAGGADQQGSIPRIRANLNLRVDWQAFDASWHVRYIHSMKDPQFDGNNGLNYERIPSHTQHDVRLAWNTDRYRFLIGVNDLFDKDPPYIDGVSNNTDAFLYDVIGRFAFLRVSTAL